MLKNRALLIQKLGLNPADLIADNPYIQSKTTKNAGCQIDYLIQTRTQNLYVCELKFKRRELGLDIIDEVQQKIKRLSVPRGIGVCPVLIHFAGVSDAVIERKYFYRIIELEDFLKH